MKIKKLGSVTFVLLLSFTFAFTFQAAADENNIKTMAEIMLKLNHYPSDSEKQTLRQITLSSTASKEEKTMANAMINIEHFASDKDKKKLSMIVDDDSAPQEARTLAKIIRDIEHKPSAEAKKQLEKLK